MEHNRLVTAQLNTGTAGNNVLSIILFPLSFGMGES